MFFRSTCQPKKSEKESSRRASERTNEEEHEKKQKNVLSATVWHAEMSAFRYMI